MGADFLSRAAKSFAKSWDRGRERLDMPQLFDDQPELKKRCFVGTPINDHKFSDKGEYLVILIGKEAQLFSGGERVGTLCDLPQQVVDEVVAKGCGCAVATVESIAEISGTADLVLH